MLTTVITCDRVGNGGGSDGGSHCRGSDNGHMLTMTMPTVWRW